MSASWDDPNHKSNLPTSGPCIGTLLVSANVRDIEPLGKTQAHLSRDLLRAFQRPARPTCEFSCDLRSIVRVNYSASTIDECSVLNQHESGHRDAANRYT